MNEEKSEGQCITAEERKKILSRFNSLLYWVGESVPSVVVLDGVKVPLKEVVFRFITEESPSEETVKGAHELASLLEQRAKEIHEDLSTKKVERERAYEIMHEALGLLRAVDQLRNVKLEVCQVKAKAIIARVSDERRWLRFVHQIKTS
ncbi:MAG: hypothetical protein JXA45_03385 [Methanomassiliicoccales archaeon]|nr:hypothetical protein [Methanomassiliicoccales archaeon]